jgi:hypothetical protein
LVIFRCGSLLLASEEMIEVRLLLNDPHWHLRTHTTATLTL